MKIELDIHTHTIASGHAYASLNEMAAAAKLQGLKLMAMTDHGPAMPGGAHIYHFHNLRQLPKEINGVRVLKGVEANIVGYNGDIDINTQVLEEMEFVIASFHSPCIEPSNIHDTTKALMNLMENKYVNVIGHPEDSRYKFELEPVIKAAKDTGTLLEINNSSLLPTTFRENSRPGLISILDVCAKYDLPIVMGSDAHYTTSVGRFDKSLALLEEIGYPEELIMNRSAEEFLTYINRNRL